jgi:hypothetical protein
VDLFLGTYDGQAPRSFSDSGSIFIPQAFITKGSSFETLEFRFSLTGDPKVEYSSASISAFTPNFGIADLVTQAVTPGGLVYNMPEFPVFP